MASGDDLQSAFKDFCDKGNEITTANTSKWMKKANCFGKSCTSNSLDIGFMKAKKDKKKKTINFDEFKELVNIMAADYAKDHKKKDQTEAVTEMTQKLSSTKNVATGTKVSSTGGVDRMTDTSKYTGAHKERFDADGKGKGIQGRENVHENTGYVGNYKGKDTYDKSKKK